LGKRKGVVKRPPRTEWNMDSRGVARGHVVEANNGQKTGPEAGAASLDHPRCLIRGENRALDYVTTSSTAGH